MIIIDLIFFRGSFNCNTQIVETFLYLPLNISNLLLQYFYFFFVLQLLFFKLLFHLSYALSLTIDWFFTLLGWWLLFLLLRFNNAFIGMHYDSGAQNWRWSVEGLTLVTRWLLTELMIELGRCGSGRFSFEYVSFDYDFDVVIVAEFETFCILHFGQREPISYLLGLAVFGKIQICLSYWQLFLFAHHYL